MGQILLRAHDQGSETRRVKTTPQAAPRPLHVGHTRYWQSIDGNAFRPNWMCIQGRKECLPRRQHAVSDDYCGDTVLRRKRLELFCGIGNVCSLGQAWENRPSSKVAGRRRSGTFCHIEIHFRLRLPEHTVPRIRIRQNQDIFPLRQVVPICAVSEEAGVSKGLSQ